MPQAHTHEKKSKAREAGNGHTQAQELPLHEADPEARLRHPFLETLKDKLELLTKKTRMEHLAKVVASRARIVKELRAIPSRMQKVTNQATLVLELVDDFREGKYRKVSWYAIGVASAALLYAVSPSDVVPDYIPGLGAIDDVLVLGIALRFIKKDLKAYCSFKGYDPEKYF